MVSAIFAQHQTETFSPVLPGNELPYRVELRQYDAGAMEVPTLHSYAKAQWDGKWVLIGGRTNGLHAFTQNGFVNFPPTFQNREVWVIDPESRQSWHRSLDEDTTGLSVTDVDSLAVTNNQFYQDNQRLYITGGYGLLTDFDFVTFDTLTAIDLPSVIEWTQNGGDLPDTTIRQIRDPLFTVTGGAMLPIDGRTHLVFGQDFQGEYTPFGNGEYTNQVRSFSIVDDGVTLAIDDVTVSTSDPAYRRRDLNVVPVIRSNGDELEQELRVLSGVFTPSGGAWTVPVEIAADGMPRMADPNDPATFRQAMSTYHSAKLGLYSELSDEMHLLQFGGISLHFVDEASQELIRDDGLPFINQSTSIVINSEDEYTQYLLPSSFPELVEESSGNTWRFGTNAEFMLAEGIEVFENGVLRMDAISEPTKLGYILGGIAADQPHRGNTVATGHVFEVLFTPVSFFDCNHDGLVSRDDLACAHANDVLPGVLDVTGLILGDIDGDGTVAFGDFLILSQNFGLPATSYTQGDLDGSGDVAFADFLMLSASFGQSSDIALVPEPGAGLMMRAVFVASLWFLGRYRGSHGRF